MSHRRGGTRPGQETRARKPGGGGLLEKSALMTGEGARPGWGGDQDGEEAGAAPGSEDRVRLVPEAARLTGCPCLAPGLPTSFCTRESPISSWPVLGSGALSCSSDALIPILQTGSPLERNGC